jgi:transcriptional regulator with XRE-family HTH domain
MIAANILGERVRNQRIARNQSLDDLAEASGVSKPMLSQIERGQSIPTITTLWKIATGLKVPITLLLAEQTAEYTIVDHRTIKPVLEDDGRMRAYPLFTYDPLRNNEMFYVEFDSQCHRIAEKHFDGVEEYLLVLTGSLELIVQNETLTLQAGQAIRFRADIPHEYKNPHSQLCTAHMLIFYPHH